MCALPDTLGTRVASNHREMYCRLIHVFPPAIDPSSCLNFLADAVEALVTAADILGFRPQHLYNEALEIHARPIPRQVYGVGSSMALFLGTYKLFNYGMVPSEALRRLNGYLSGVLECISGEANPEGISITG